MIGGVNTDITRDSWTNVPGRKKILAYNADNKPTKITCIDGTTTVYAIYLTYDENGNVTEIECKES